MITKTIKSRRNSKKGLTFHVKFVSNPQSDSITAQRIEMFNFSSNYRYQKYAIITIVTKNLRHKKIYEIYRIKKKNTKKHRGRYFKRGGELTAITIYYFYQLNSLFDINTTLINNK